MPPKKRKSKAPKAAKTTKTKQDKLPVLPDPARDADAIKLGTLSYPVKAVKGYTINSIKSKLKRHGVQVTRQTLSNQNSNIPAYFDLNNLFAVSSVHDTCFKAPKFLSIASPNIDAALGEGQAATETRLRQIKILTVNGRITDIIVKLPAAANATAAATSILQQAHALLNRTPAARNEDNVDADDADTAAADHEPEDQQQQYDFQESHLLAYRGCLREGRSEVVPVDAGTVLTDTWFMNNNLLVLLLPEDPAEEQAPAAGKGKKRQHEDAAAQADQQRFMLVFNSICSEHDSQLVPLLLEMPSAAVPISVHHLNVVQKIQDFLMEPGWIRDAAWSGRVASAREELQDKLTSYRELKLEAKTALAADPNNEERKRHFRFWISQVKRIKEKLEQSDEDLELDRDDLELFVDTSALQYSIERNLHSIRCSFDDRMAARDERKKWSYLHVLQAAAQSLKKPATSSAEADAAAGAQGNTAGTAGSGGAESSAAAAAAAAAAATAAAQADDISEVQFVAYGRVAVLYASWKTRNVARDYDWSVSAIKTSDQQQAKVDLAAQTKSTQDVMLQAYHDQQPLLAIIQELQDLSTFVRMKPSGNQRGVRHKPSIAVTLDLQQAGRGKPAREGTLKITVYTWSYESARARNHRSIDSRPGQLAAHRPWEISAYNSSRRQHSQWVNTVTSVQPHDRDPWPGGQPPADDTDAPHWLRRNKARPVNERVLLKQSTSFPLILTIRALLEHQVLHRGVAATDVDGGALDRFVEHAREWDSYQKRYREVGNLMLYLLKTGPYPAAQQPFGFFRGDSTRPAVVLKPHQLEALTLLKAAEARPYGFNSVVWKEVQLNGRSWWLSLITGKISSSPPPKQVTGGILAEEMGVGKTIEILALILANKAPAKGPGDTAPGQLLPEENEGTAAAAGVTGDEEGGDDVMSGGEDDQEDDGDDDEDDQDQNDYGDDDDQDQAADMDQDDARPPQDQGQQQQQQQQPGNAQQPAAAAAAAAAGPTAAAATTPLTGLRYSRATLVVCAVTLVGQWASEAKKMTAGNLKILQYHGSGRKRYTVDKLAKDYDIVVTTYNTLATEICGRRSHCSETGSPLAHIKWWRIVFDEGHVLKNKTTIQARAASRLVSDRRWVVTGTPIDKEVMDFHGELMALQVWPFTEAKFSQQHCHTAFKNLALEAGLCNEARQMPLVHFLKEIVIRHTKEVLQLPQKTEENIPVYLTAVERTHYRKALVGAQRQWRLMGSHCSMKQQGLRALALLQPMRRICSGGRLSTRALTVRDFAGEAEAARAAEAQRLDELSNRANEAMTALLDGRTPDLTAFSAAAAAAAGGGSGRSAAAAAGGGGNECCVCLEAPEEPQEAPCGHVFCNSCIRDNLKTDKRCPTCFQPLTAGMLKPWQQDAVAAGAAAALGGRGAAAADEEDDPGVLCESKLLKLKEELLSMRASDSTAKALIFSSFQATVDHLKEVLPSWGFSFRYINGAMAMPQRTKAIEAFQQDPPTTVFILTMRSAACGVNLTAASHVYLLEPCMSPALEEQAIGRAWRMGQKRQVQVKRLYVKGSIEERTMELAASAADRVAKGACHLGTLKGDKYSLWKDNMDRLLEDYELPVQPPTQRPAAAGTSAAAEAAGPAAAAAAGPSARAAAAAVAAAGEDDDNGDDHDDQDQQVDHDHQDQDDDGDDHDQVVSSDHDSSDDDQSSDVVSATSDLDEDDHHDQADNHARAGHYGLNTARLAQQTPMPFRSLHTSLQQPAAAAAVAEINSDSNEDEDEDDESVQQQQQDDKEDEEDEAAADVDDDEAAMADGDGDVDMGEDPAAAAASEDGEEEVATDSAAAGSDGEPADEQQAAGQAAAEAAPEDQDQQEPDKGFPVNEPAAEENVQHHDQEDETPAAAAMECDDLPQQQQQQQENDSQHLEDETAAAVPDAVLEPEDQPPQQEQQEEKAVSRRGRKRVVDDSQFTREQQAEQRKMELLHQRQQERQQLLEELKKRRLNRQQQQQQEGEGDNQQADAVNVVCASAAAAAADTAAEQEEVVPDAAAGVEDAQDQENQGQQQQQQQQSKPPVSAAAARAPLSSIDNIMPAAAAGQDLLEDKASKPAPAAAAPSSRGSPSAAAAADVFAPAGGAQDPAFSDFVIELMNALQYDWDKTDAAEAKLMAVADRAVLSAAAATTDTQKAAQRWLHQFNAGLIRRHTQLVAAVKEAAAAAAAAGSSGDDQVCRAEARLKSWIDQGLLATAAAAVE